MKKRIVISIGFSVIIFIGIITGVSAELYQRAPDTIPGTLPEMRNPSYWIARMNKPDEVILTPQEIQRMNEQYQKRMKSPDPFKNEPEERKPRLTYWWPGMVLYPPDLQKMTPDAVADTVKKRIKDCIAHLRKREFGNLNAVEYADWQIDEFESEMALDQVKNQTTVLEGIAVRTARLRSVPTFTPDQAGISENGKTRWDLWNVAILKIGMPVKVLHRSKSGEYVFVLCEYGYGWARTVDIAFSYKQKIDEFVNAGDFVVCTGDRVPFYSDQSCMYSSGWFRMGDRLPLASKGNPRTVLVPVRRMDGEFTTETAWLAEDADVHVGWLPYTRKNVIVTALKLLDNNYDWTGGWFGRQHETTYRDIFCCFGFDLPYHGGLFTFFNRNDEQVIPSDVGREEQYKAILKREPFITLQSCGGHAQLLLGEYNGTPIVLDQHGYGYKDESGTFLEIRRCCVGDVTLPTYFLRRPVTFLVLK